MLFFLFVVWMAVIIMNLLIGLTITGIEELNREGKKMKILERLSYCKEHVQANLLDFTPKFGRPGGKKNLLDTYEKRYPTILRVIWYFKKQKQKNT